jgi:hypothetical protein
MGLMDDLLTKTESILLRHGATRIWIDPTQPGTTILAEFPEAAATSASAASVTALHPLV